MSLAPLVTRHYLIFCRLFGVRCEHFRRGGHREPVPLAAGRGLLPRPSVESARVMDRLDDVSWASLDEVEAAFVGVVLDEHEWGWSFALDSMRLFGQKHGRDRVRLVVGFTS